MSAAMTVNLKGLSPAQLRALSDRVALALHSNTVALTRQDEAMWHDLCMALDTRREPLQKFVFGTTRNGYGYNKWRDRVDYLNNYVEDSVPHNCNVIVKNMVRRELLKLVVADISRRALPATPSTVLDQLHSRLTVVSNRAFPDYARNRLLDKIVMFAPQS
jgi:hypothetical protein